MTTEELKQYYSDLLIKQYLGKAKAEATIKSVVEKVIADQIPLTVESAYDLETAVGAQLDILGTYAGVTRTGNLFNGDAITLDDDDFRSFIKMAIIRNTSGSDLYSIDNLLNTYFPGQIYVFDEENMQINYWMLSSAGSSELAQMFLLQDMFPKPMGVELSSLVYVPSISGYFGMVSYQDPANPNVTGMTDYATGFTIQTWLKYADTITLS